MWCHVLAVSSCLPRWRCVCARVFGIWQLVATTMKWWWWCQRCCLLIHLWTSIRDSLHFSEWSLYKQYKPKWHIPICIFVSLALSLFLSISRYCHHFLCSQIVKALWDRDETPYWLLTKDNEFAHSFTLIQKSGSKGEKEAEEKKKHETKRTHKKSK